MILSEKIEQRISFSSLKSPVALSQSLDFQSFGKVVTDLIYSEPFVFCLTAKKIEDIFFVSLPRIVDSSKIAEHDSGFELLIVIMIGDYHFSCEFLTG